MIIGIEGHNSAGKTTLFGRLLSKDNCAGIAELTTMIPFALSFPQSEPEAISNERIISRLECNRISTARLISREKHFDHILMDRSIISTLIISLSNAKVYGWNNVRYLLDDLLNYNIPLLPEAILHLDGDTATRSGRHLSRQNQLAAGWSDLSFEAWQTTYYNWIYAYLSANKFTTVIHIDANRTADEVYLQAQAALLKMRSAEKPPGDAMFLNWLKDDISLR